MATSQCQQITISRDEHIRRRCNQRREDRHMIRIIRDRCGHGVNLHPEPRAAQTASSMTAIPSSGGTFENACASSPWKCAYSSSSVRKRSKSSISISAAT